MSEARLTPEGEAAWLRLKHHLEWSESFALGFIFSGHGRLIELFRERVAAIYRARVTRLQTPEINSRETLIPQLLPRLLNPTIAELALHAPLWIDLSRQQDHWQETRLELLARLNEQRERLRQVQHRPVVLILPAAERKTIRALIPDLWAIRSFCLDTADWQPAAARPPTPRPRHCQPHFRSIPMNRH